MFNTGDVYSTMAQVFFADHLDDSDKKQPSGEFKHKCPQLRNRMKTCTLGIIYGLPPHGLALQLGIKPEETSLLLAKFMAMFPELAQALQVP